MSENEKCWICGRTEEEVREQFQSICDRGLDDEKKAKLPKGDLYCPDDDNDVFIRVRQGKITEEGYIKIDQEIGEVAIPICAVCSALLWSMFELIEDEYVSKWDLENAKIRIQIPEKVE